MNSSLALSVFTVLCGHHLCLVPAHLSPQSEPHTPGLHSPLPPPAPGNTSELPVSVGLPVLDGSCKWNQTIHVRWVWLLSAQCLQGTSALWVCGAVSPSRGWGVYLALPPRFLYLLLGPPCCWDCFHLSASSVTLLRTCVRKCLFCQ